MPDSDELRIVTAVQKIGLDLGKRFDDKIGDLSEKVEDRISDLQQTVTASRISNASELAGIHVRLGHMEETQSTFRTDLKDIQDKQNSCPGRSQMPGVNARLKRLELPPRSDDSTVVEIPIIRESKADDRLSIKVPSWAWKALWPLICGGLAIVYTSFIGG